MKRFFAGILALALSLALCTNIASALTADERSLYRNSGIFFYNPGGYNSDNSCLPTPQTTEDGRPGQDSGTVTVGHTKAFMDRWHDTAVQVQILYGIPWEGVMAQGALESDWGRSGYAINKNAYFGVNAVNDNPDAGYGYATPELSWYGSTSPPSYAETIQRVPTYRNHGAFNHTSDPLGYVAAIARAGYAVPDDYYAQIAAGKNREDILYNHYYPTLANIINNIITPYSQEQGWDNSADVTSKNPEATSNAEGNAQGATATDGNPPPQVDPCLPGSIPGSNTDGLPFDIDGTNGARVSACWGYYPDGGAHAGIDFALNKGTPIYATMAGTVKWVGRKNNNPDGYGNGGGFGYYISIQHEDGTVAIYGHLQNNSAFVQVGDKVSKGQPIGRSGNTGNSTGPHLHFEIQFNGQPMSPMAYLGDFSSINGLGCK